MQWRTIWMDGRPHPPGYVPHTHMGFSTGEWHGDILTVTTTHIKKEFYRRSGAPSSEYESTCPMRPSGPNCSVASWNAWLP